MIFSSLDVRKRKKGASVTQVITFGEMESLVICVGQNRNK